VEIAFHALAELLGLVGETFHRIGSTLRVLGSSQRAVGSEFRAPSRIDSKIRLLDPRTIRRCDRTIGEAKTYLGAPENVGARESNFAVEPKVVQPELVRIEGPCTIYLYFFDPIRKAA